MPVAQAAKKSFEFHIWERLHITVGDEGNEGRYTCRIADVKQGRLIITRPTFERGKSLLADNRMVMAACSRADAAYSFTARIKELDPKSADEMALVEMGRVKRLQRRRYVRLNKSINLTYRIITRPIDKPVPLDDGQMIKSRSVNLSAAGLLILLDDETRPKMDDFLLISFEPNNFTHLPDQVLAIVRHVLINEQQVRMAGIEFIIKEDLPRHFRVDQFKLLPAEVKNFDDRQLNQLVSELFAEQLDMRQKGLL